MPIKPITSILLTMVLATVLSLVACKKSEERILRAPENDPRLIAATEEARRRWPEFVAEFNKREPNTAYAVKLAFTLRSGGKEYMWIQVQSIEGEKITGTLDNVPEGDAGYKRGDRVQSLVSEVLDWMVGKGANNIKGCFSLPVLEQIEREARGGP